MLMQWNDALSSGVHEIDAQHQQLIGLVNGLIQSFDKESDQSHNVTQIVQYLTDYVVFHFGAEEKHMATYGYPSMKAHVAQHEQFVRTFLRLKDRIIQEGTHAELSADTKQVVVDWLLNHIKYSDRALGMFLKLKM